MEAGGVVGKISEIPFSVRPISGRKDLGRKAPWTDSIGKEARGGME